MVTIEGTIKEYAENIKHPTKSWTPPPKIKLSNDGKHVNIDKKLHKKNDDNNVDFLDQQIRLNNLKEVDNYKQITIYILYFILLLSCGLLFYLLK
jgi:hypothetical protein